MKKLISVLLTLTMLFSFCIPAFAVDEKAAYEGNPVVIVRGISFMNLKNADGSSAIQVNSGKVLGLLLQSVVTRFAISNEDALYEAFAEAVNDVFRPIAYDKDGKPINEIYSTQYTASIADSPNYGHFNDAEGGLVREAVNRYGAENVYLFTYDWRKSAKELAAELDTLIEKAKTDSGKDQVDIICASMGCMITTAYFTYFGYSNINKAVYVSGAHNGVYAVGDAFSGNVSVDKDTVVGMIDSMVSGNIFTKILLTVLDWLGAFDYLTDFINNWFDKYFERANEDVFRDSLGTLPGLWALCPDDKFDSAYETVFGGCEEEYAGVCATIKETGRFIKSSDAVIAGAYLAGVEISFIANYNTPGIPVYDSAVLNGDGTIETVLCSNGATVALCGETLSDEYIAGLENKSYVSPDKVVDASTALYRDFTWFIKDAEHVATDYGTECNEFVFVLFESELQPTIYSFEEYPQFLIATESRDLAPLE